MSLPDSFIARTKLILKDEFTAFEAALSTPAPTSIRINNKIDYLPTNDTISHCPNGCYLAERPLFTADPLFHGGAYYVQEASSMFLYQAVKQCFPNANRVLDLCAAPGGKSTLLAQTLPESCLLVSNEIIHSRAQILAENILKWGNPNVVVTNNEASHFSKLEHYFDAIVVDAPCSGEGMFRKDPNAINEWSVDNVMNCVNRQRDILIDSWDALKPGGIMVYSTCTFNREENEENVHWICTELGAEIMQLAIEDTNIVITDGGYRFYPHRMKGEGFFMAVIRKNESAIKELNFKLVLDKNTKKINANELPFKLMDFTHFSYYNINNRIIAFDSANLNELLFLRSKYKCLVAGIEMFELKGRDYIPTAQLALSKLLDTTSCTLFEVDYNTAIRFLKREAIELNDADKGYLLLTFKGLTLGWVKNIGNRCNNLYPQHWRIRMNL